MKLNLKIKVTTNPNNLLSTIIDRLFGIIDIKMLSLVNGSGVVNFKLFSLDIGVKDTEIHRFSLPIEFVDIRDQKLKNLLDRVGIYGIEKTEHVVMFDVHKDILSKFVSILRDSQVLINPTGQDELA